MPGITKELVYLELPHHGVFAQAPKATHKSFISKTGTFKLSKQLLWPWPVWQTRRPMKRKLFPFAVHFCELCHGEDFSMEHFDEQDFADKDEYLRALRTAQETKLHYCQDCGCYVCEHCWDHDHECSKRNTCGECGKEIVGQVSNDCEICGAVYCHDCDFDFPGDCLHKSCKTCRAEGECECERCQNK